MPQSFVLESANKAKETEGNLEETASNTKLLLELIALQRQTNLLLTAINITLGGMGEAYVAPEDVLDSLPDVIPDSPS